MTQEYTFGSQEYTFRNLFVGNRGKERGTRAERARLRESGIRLNTPQQLELLAGVSLLEGLLTIGIPNGADNDGVEKDDEETTRSRRRSRSTQRSRSSRGASPTCMGPLVSMPLARRRAS